MKRTEPGGEEITRTHDGHTEYASLAAALTPPLPAVSAKSVSKPSRQRQLLHYYAWAALTACTPANEGDPASVVQAAQATAQDLAARSGPGVDSAALEPVAALISSFVASRGVEIVPVAAVLGGLLGNEVIKLVSLRDAPVDNFLVFDSTTGLGAAIVRAGGGGGAGAASTAAAAPVTASVAAEAIECIE